MIFLGIDQAQVGGFLYGLTEEKCVPRTIEDKDALIFSANEVCEFGEHVEIPEMPLSHKPSTYWIIVTSDPRQIHIGRIVLRTASPEL
jgi:hypothetical protein